ncbi:hypothetical protein ANO11243_083060 [Dothideomycetidae sp. 11243]|nr:hypothetical protein ANO11243_083060 [fungal sp. No.11243]
MDLTLERLRQSQTSTTSANRRADRWKEERERMCMCACVFWQRLENKKRRSCGEAVEQDFRNEKCGCNRQEMGGDCSGDKTKTIATLPDYRRSVMVAIDDDEGDEGEVVAGRKGGRDVCKAGFADGLAAAVVSECERSCFEFQQQQGQRLVDESRRTQEEMGMGRSAAEVVDEGECKRAELKSEAEEGGYTGERERDDGLAGGPGGGQWAVGEGRGIEDQGEKRGRVRVRVRERAWRGLWRGRGRGRGRRRPSVSKSRNRERGSQGAVSVEHPPLYGKREGDGDRHRHQSASLGAGLWHFSARHSLWLWATRGLCGVGGTHSIQHWWAAGGGHLLGIDRKNGDLQNGQGSTAGSSCVRSTNYSATMRNKTN